MGYHRGQLGIVSMSSRDVMSSSIVPTGGSGTAKAKSSTFAKQDVVLMTLSGNYHGGSSSSSFEKDDVFIKELKLFVTDSLWCYLRLHGLMDDTEESQQQQEGGGDNDLGNNSRQYDERRNLRAEFKNGKKKERVLSRVFKKVIGE